MSITLDELLQADSYQTLRSAANGEIKGSIIDLQDETEVSIVKRAFGHIFAAKNVMDYEEDVNETRDVLLQSIRKTRTFDLFAMMSHFQADFLLNIAFGDQAHYLKTGADSNHLSFDARYQHWMKWQCMPYLESLLYKPPILMRYFKGAIPLWARMANEKLQARLTGKNANVRSDLLDKYIEGGEKRGDRLPIEAVPRMVSSTISAGFDTTAITMNSMIYYLCRNPSAMKKLRAEFAAANLSLLPDFHETQHLKYLDAVLKETLRLNPFLQVLFEREVPAGGAKLCGKYFPEGTVVGCHPTITHRDAFFGQDPNGFHPERWLIDDAGKLLEMERCSLWFGNGKRICLGRHLAEMEIKKVVPAMITGFDVRASRLLSTPLKFRAQMPKSLQLPRQC